MDLEQRDAIAVEFGKIASEAGAAIMTIRASDKGATLKSDGTPVSQADIEAERLIQAQLAWMLPGMVVIAEESFTADYDVPVPERFLLVDPLDGTREYLSGQADFTVNIALIEAGCPIAGAICAPAMDLIYLGGSRAFRAELSTDGIFAPESLTAIEARTVPRSGMRAAASRSHLDPQTEQFLREQPVSELRPAGSSLKFCLIACGEADVYPRFGPTMEWDTAAGHAVLTAAGGCVLALDGSPLRYGKKDIGFKNNGFVAWGRRPSG